MGGVFRTGGPTSPRSLLLSLLLLTDSYVKQLSSAFAFLIDTSASSDPPPLLSTDRIIIFSRHQLICATMCRFLFIYLFCLTIFFLYLRSSLSFSRIPPPRSFLVSFYSLHPRQNVTLEWNRNTSCTCLGSFSVFTFFSLFLSLLSLFIYYIVPPREIHVTGVLAVFFFDSDFTIEGGLTTSWKGGGGATAVTLKI